MPVLVTSPLFAPAGLSVPWTPSSAPALRPQRGDPSVRDRAARALFPTGASEAWDLLAQALLQGWQQGMWDPWSAERWLHRQILLFPISVRDALHLKGEALWRKAQAHQERQWVHDQGLRPQRRLGDRVDLVVRGEPLQGLLVTIDATQGYYGIRLGAWCADIPEPLGHAGVQIPWEMVDDLTRVPMPLGLCAPAQCVARMDFGSSWE